MTDDLMNMFVQDATKAYDFDKIDLQKKEEFIEKVFLENAKPFETSSTILFAHIPKEIY